MASALPSDRWLRAPNSGRTGFVGSPAELLRLPVSELLQLLGRKAWGATTLSRAVWLFWPELWQKVETLNIETKRVVKLHMRYKLRYRQQSFRQCYSQIIFYPDAAPRFPTRMSELPFGPCKITWLHQKLLK